MNCLRRDGIATVGELVSKKPKELIRLRNFGQKSFREIEERLKEIGLSLVPQVEAEKENGKVAQTEETAE
jgi:DNA-directed RNA polymerase subunit alpha